MLHKPSPVFDRIRDGVFTLPVIDCHEHMGGPRYTVPVREPIAALTDGYFKDALNVVLNLAWLYIIDPLYAKEMLERAVVSVPHSKVHGFGGDYHDTPEYSAAHLKIARQVIASSLADLVECGWLQEDEALDVAADWLFNNPNRFWKLGLEPVLRRGK